MCLYVNCTQNSRRWTKRTECLRDHSFRKVQPIKYLHIDSFGWRLKHASLLRSIGAIPRNNSNANATSQHKMNIANGAKISFCGSSICEWGGKKVICRESRAYKYSDTISNARSDALLSSAHFPVFSKGRGCFLIHDELFSFNSLAACRLLLHSEQKDTPKTE